LHNRHRFLGGFAEGIQIRDFINRNPDDKEYVPIPERVFVNRSLQPGINEIS
jgi:hypothetical protein